MFQGDPMIGQFVFVNGIQLSEGERARLIIELF